MADSAESRWWFHRLALPVRITSAVIAIVLVGGAAYWIYSNVRTCGPGVERIDEQCIGVTDGSVVLTSDLADVLGKIRQENKWVDDNDPQGEAVSVAYLTALPEPSSSQGRAAKLRHELEGVYLAQVRANHTDTLGGGRPLIRLLIANDGNRSIHWGKVVPELVDKADGPERLVAVVATGQTVAARQESINELLSQNIPVIASQLTGDNLVPSGDSSSTQGLARIAPSNSDQAAAAAAYLKPNTRNVLLIQNTDPRDGYSRSLGEAFARAYPDDTHELLKPVENYNPQLGGVASTMRGMLVNICYKKPDAIFFAGRGEELGALVEALPSRTCPDVPINIMTGDAATDFSVEVARGRAELRAGLSLAASVKYTTLAHPASWKEFPDSFAQGSRQPFQGSCDNCFSTLFPDSLLDDGAAITGYDAVVTAIAAVRTREGINDDPDLIIQQFNRMHGPRAVAGASGWISLGAGGKAINKAVPILEVKLNGTVEFVQLSAPRGAPCNPDIPQLC
ncbi:MAG: ABC transporter substrate-binding protein [Pseudonocardiaceae bacterium]